MADVNLLEASTVMEDLYLKYRPLVGTIFQAKYLGPFPMPQTGNTRDVLLIVSDCEVLRNISSAVLQSYGRRIWKGVTGPLDSRRYPDYWLWVEPGFEEVLSQEDVCYEFKVKHCCPFQCRDDDDSDFDFGVSIKVAVIPNKP